MNRNLHYFALFIFSIMIASSLYLSWTADRGFGELQIERLTIEREEGRVVDFMVYSPRSSTYGKPLPIIMTTHGIAGSKEGMYSFNIELARRNFTVVSVDLPGHGDSMLSFEVTNFLEMAQDCYAAVQEIQKRPEVNSTAYGVLTHSLGFQVAAQMQYFDNPPMGYAAVGAVADMGLGVIEDIPGNLLIAIGEYDEMISEDMALDTIREATGLESVIPETTYGSIENQTAYRLELAPTDHVFEAIDSTIVTETTKWLIHVVQGEIQLEKTLSPTQHVYIYKVIAMATGAFSLLASTIPLLMIAVSVLPKRMNVESIANEVESQPLKKVLGMSLLLGTIFVAIFGATSAITFHLEAGQLYFVNSMFASGLVLFFILFSLALVAVLWIFTGSKNTLETYRAAGLELDSPRLIFKRIGKALIPAAVCIIWLLGWTALGGIPHQMEPWTTFSMIRYPVGLRTLNIILLTMFSLPFFVSDSAWIRGILLTNRDWNGESFSKSLILSLAGRLTAVGILSVVLVFGSTALGFIAGSMVLMGLLLMLFFVVSILTTILIAQSSLEFQNPWPAIILSSFIWAWVAVSSIPLI
ncbi:hypothetical protein EU537_08160 [Candidatus Thorarchaeota archaeon]|nr:MAG: hypothetical protein EU537_08160 [Candidatus Thorarchaeota archaeon]